MAAALSAVLLAAACTVGPNYTRPELALPADYIAPQPEGSAPVDSNWWATLNDQALLTLQQKAEAYSPTLEQAVARIGIARATLSSSRADAFPTVNASGSYTKSGEGFGNSDDDAVVTGQNGFQAGVDASWEIDLFGKVRRNNQAASARVTARQYDWSDARIALLAEVADDYVQLRGCEQLADIYNQQSVSQSESARLTRISANAGFTAPADAELAEAAAASISASLIDQRAQCDLLVKALVSLSGEAESEVRALLAPDTGVLPQPATLAVTSVPADLVRQRPDVASSERELEASSAEIGVAVADLYPSISLSGSITIGGGTQQWSFGPQLSLPLFDGGKRRANVRSARASYDLQHGVYREAVRSAVLEVEQALVRLDSARSRQADVARSAAGYQANYRAIQDLYRVGSTSIIERESARRNALDAQRSLVDVNTTQLREWIALYLALGGGWDSSVDVAAAADSKQANQ